MADDAKSITDPTTDAAATTDSTAADSGKTFTQEQVNDLLARQKGDVQRKFSDYDDLKTKAAQFDELQTANATEIEKAQGKATKADQRADTAEAKLLRYEVAAEKQVPPKLVPLLTAASREDLEVQADLILENAKTEPPPEFDGGTRETTPDPQTPQEAHNKLLLGLLGRTPS